MKFVDEVKKQTLTLMIAAFGFVAALVWKDAISAWMAPIIAEGGAVELTVGALVVTVVVVIVGIVLTKYLGEGK